jgi:DNA-directed RNA polymerase specialized sigma24 family protein
MASRRMNNDDFTSFLDLLSSTGGGDGALCYVRLYRRLEGFFTMRGVRDPAGAADETIDVAVRRIAEGTPVPDAGKYCMGIARNIANDRLRRERRELKAFLGFIADLDNNSGEQAARIEQVLKPCFEQLAGEDRELLVAYCYVMRGRARGEHRRELALKMNTSVQGLRMRVTRLRKELTDCAGKRSKGH